ncbi:hypothetical protein KFK09_012187 [Dendrobium nobile]|uniref:Nodal modulator 1 n=1 Tax=Dendrobium nobile TaxID=94219 RepID=A0A8T3BH66_DENNO|nr:hypothetical protein KFK09_012187 [Dendrobium nobile]
MALANLFVCLLFALSASLSSANSIHGCGGFVEASSVLIKSRKPSDRKLDYSHVTVELQTIDGLVKDKTSCTPNGYYFIPVYDKGSFIVKVKGPEGWSWDPDKVPVIVDKSGCNSNADINFQLTGFMVSGRVSGSVGGGSCPSKAGGPSNVKVELVSMPDDAIVSSFTSETGDYSFTNIIPGFYKLRASHPNLGVELRGSSEINLGFENAVVDDIFFVSGYDLHGFVVSQGNPILGVHIYLYSADVLEVHCPQGVGNPPSENKALCHSISNADGKFTFKSLPCGVYDLLPYYKGENTVFDVSPPSMTVTVEHHHVTVSQKFQFHGLASLPTSVLDVGTLAYLTLHLGASAAALAHLSLQEKKAISSPNLTVTGACPSPEVDHGFAYNPLGDIDILHSPFYEPDWEYDESVEDYVNRIIYCLAETIDLQKTKMLWLIIGHRRFLHRRLLLHQRTVYDFDFTTILDVILTSTFDVVTTSTFQNDLYIKVCHCLDIDARPQHKDT